MTRPSSITTAADVHALVDEIAPESALRLALDILERESGSWVLFMRLGDDDPPRDDGSRLFGSLRHADPEDPADAARVREAVEKWLVGKN